MLKTRKKPKRKVAQRCYIFVFMMRGNITLFGAFLLMGLFFSGQLPAHPFYVSVTEVHADTQKNTLTVSCRMFTDDLENALKQIFNRPFDLLNASSDKETNSLLDAYIQKHFSIGVAGVLQKLQFVGFEHEEEATWCYLESVNFSGLGSVTVTNTLLYDFIPDQVNIIHFYAKGSRRSARLVNPEKSVGFQF